MSAAHIAFITVAALAAVCILIHTALVVYAVVIALNTSDKKRRQAALRVLRMLSPALSLKLGPVAISRGEAPETPERRELSE
ncbi:MULTISPECIES: hypothetical protein [Amycolatopsis]|uniref:Uncharacterized protein n=1 Tax=Amycolatopsis saalfeldensis TaxID=394193 RepID=A0A1H8YN14_9PSEU|nr:MULTISPECIES: hypothetical protein [Amycolatopsis]SEP53594.1 hypothetical protein SAMN04489732_12919 [Amycolatopsis saalfeldensis]